MPKFRKKISFRTHRRRQAKAAAAAPTTPSLLPPSPLSLPLPLPLPPKDKVIDKVMDEPESPPCPICHVPIGTETPEGVVETWSELPCTHRFGSVCAKRWLGVADQPACPICRVPMMHVCGHPVLPVLSTMLVSADSVQAAVVSGADSAADAGVDADAVGVVGDAIIEVAIRATVEGEGSSDNRSGEGKTLEETITVERPVTPPSAPEDAYLDPTTPLSAASTTSSALSSPGSTPSLLSSSPNSSAASSPTSPILFLGPGAHFPFKRKRNPQPSIPSSSGPRLAPDTSLPCDFCIAATLRITGEDMDNAAGRAASLALRMVTHHNARNSNAVNAHWERWRKAHNTEFGQWWAVQEPPTEPARELPVQGWSY